MIIHKHKTYSIYMLVDFTFYLVIDIIPFHLFIPPQVH